MRESERERERKGEKRIVLTGGDVAACGGPDLSGLWLQLQKLEVELKEGGRFVRNASPVGTSAGGGRRHKDGGRPRVSP